MAACAPLGYKVNMAYDQVQALDQAGLTIEEEGFGSGYHHFVARKKAQ
jgi:hypothetical protein